MSKDSLYIVGKHPVLDALEQGVKMEKVFVLRTLSQHIESQIADLCNKLNVPLQHVPKPKLDRLHRGNHQGIIGQRALIEYVDLHQLLQEIDEDAILLILDGITDVRNLGAIARTAELFQVDALITKNKGAATINSDALKTSAGALQFLPICRVGNMAAAVADIKMHGFKILASSLSSKNRLEETDLKGSVAIILGSEDKGVSTDVLKKTSGTFKIPQFGKTDSFNVSVSAGIVLYEAMKQRSQP